MSDDPAKLEYAKLCAQAGNAIVIFSVLQALTFLYALGREPVIQLGVRDNLCGVRILMVAATFVYVAVIVMVGRIEAGLLKGRVGHEVFVRFSIARCLVVVATGAGIFGVTYFN